METLRDQLIRHEGLRLTVYRDSLGIETIGVGRNLRDRGLTKTEAMMLLDNDIADVQRDLDRLIPTWRTLPVDAQTVLQNMCFNLGVVRLSAFKRMLAAIEVRDYQQAADQMLNSKWATQVGNRAQELASIMRGCA